METHADRLELTLGGFATEADSAAALDERLNAAGCWHVYREVHGELSQARPAQLAASHHVRIDRLLLPKHQLTSSGWVYGAVGIEIKRSGVDIGPVIAQALDYGRSLWRLPDGVRVWADWIFIWPMARPHGTVESIFAQNRIGAAHITFDGDLRLLCSSSNTLITVGRDGGYRLGHPTNGRKVGSR